MSILDFGTFRITRAQFFQYSVDINLHRASVTRQKNDLCWYHSELLLFKQASLFTYLVRLQGIWKKKLNKKSVFFFCLCATTTKMDGKPKKPDISEQERIEMESSWELLSEKLPTSESWKVCNVTSVNLHYSQTPH